MNSLKKRKQSEKFLVKPKKILFPVETKLFENVTKFLWHTENKYLFISLEMCYGYLLCQNISEKMSFDKIKS